jgi:archaellum component FlaC
MREARRDMNQKVDDLAASGNDAIRRAQEKAEVETQDVSEALRKAGENLRRSIETQLNGIDKRVATAREAVGEKTGEVRAKSEKTLDDVARKTESVRQDLKTFETKTIQSIEAFSKQINDRLKELGKSIDGIESQD